jgi:hypothetical protein
VPPRSRKRPGTTCSEPTPFVALIFVARSGHLFSCPEHGLDGGSRFLLFPLEWSVQGLAGNDTEENEMNGWTEYESGRKDREEIRHELAVARRERLARANRETRPYVVRDLSWELARYLDTEIFSESATATPNSAREWHRRKREEVGDRRGSRRETERGASSRALFAGQGYDDIRTDRSRAR